MDQSGQMTSYPRRSPCPCGSGKKYRQCCANKSFKFVYKDGRLHKVTPVGRDVMELLLKHRRAFGAKFKQEGRESNALEKFRRAAIAGMQAVGADPAHIFAFQQSGYFVTGENRHLIPDVGLKAWDRAVEQWRSRH